MSSGPRAKSSSSNIRTHSFIPSIVTLTGYFPCPLYQVTGNRSVPGTRSPYAIRNNRVLWIDPAGTLYPENKPRRRRAKANPNSSIGLWERAFSGASLGCHKTSRPNKGLMSAGGNKLQHLMSRARKNLEIPFLSPSTPGFIHLGVFRRRSMERLQISLSLCMPVHI